MDSRPPWEQKFLPKEADTISKFLLTKANSSRSVSADHPSLIWKKHFQIESMDGLFTMVRPDTIAILQVLTMEPNLPLEISSESLLIWWKELYLIIGTKLAGEWLLKTNN
jgi:hypothetical protein